MGYRVVYRSDTEGKRVGRLIGVLTAARRTTVIDHLELEAGVVRTSRHRVVGISVWNKRHEACGDVRH